MRDSDPEKRAQRLKALQAEVSKLYSELEKIKPTGAVMDSIKVHLEKTEARFKRIKNPDGVDAGYGEFFLLIHITALEKDVFVPLSIASSKKPTGFVYGIEGTAEGVIETTNISVSGERVTQITLGTLLYAKIPKGMTAVFRILVEMKGQAHKSYRIVINRINYKFDPDDARYKRYQNDIHSKDINFS